ncbi:MAG: glycine cleavage system aminomethyltransferase GcvT [Rhodobacteraceae bacterium]|nr:glycine cleavage system aminomethyltransferase GcvT [Paracoccaceae bacterium]MCY4197161.1 glycine cleavage system aminomethyltransferase GcvT [Paracoccaceae bacterium]MCY4326413.1 glycine cleavage system aminomethyltransferase GcvT [Paracoccaceae bacterium]
MSDIQLRGTPLLDLHKRHDGKMIAFADHELPIQYAGGIISEHLHTRRAASLFDVSHMGQIRLMPRAGQTENAARALERLVPSDMLALPVGRQRYCLLTNDNGGIIDDVMAARRDDGWHLVVNAARKFNDLERLREGLETICAIELLEDRALLAIQGPAAAGIMDAVVPGSGALRFMELREFSWSGTSLLVARSGYTGEDGFEISIPGESADALADRLLGYEQVELAGLGARDSLRLEAGFCLFGHDIDESTSPVEAGLEWTIQKARRPDGVRAGGFPGEKRIFAELAEGPSVRRIGIYPTGKVPIREGAGLFATVAGEQQIGRVTSGGYGATFGGPVSMGYIDTSFAGTDREIFAGVRGRMIAAKCGRLPFVRHRMKTTSA